MLKESVGLISTFGAWGVVAICVIIIGVLIYGIIKTTKTVKDSKQLKAQINLNDKSIIVLIKNLITQNTAQSRGIIEKINKVEEEVSDFNKSLHELDKSILTTSLEQKQTTNNIDKIVNKIMDIAVDLKGLALNIKKNGNGNGKK